PSGPWHRQMVPASPRPPGGAYWLGLLSPVPPSRQSLADVLRLVKRALPRPVPIVSTRMHVAHVRRLAQPHHRVVVHEDHRLVLAEGWNRFVQRARQIEALALPVAR